MISLTEGRTPPPHHLLAAPGGYVWWYMDLIGPNGEGCVLIWSFGLPFLPGRESGARAGRARTPAEQPSLNVALYRQRRVALYTLSEFPAEQASWTEGTECVQIGRSRMRSTLSGDTRLVEAELDLDLPDGRRCTGTFSARGPAVRSPRGLVGDPRHGWSPLLTACEGEVEVAVGGEPFLAFRGRAYHDRNVCEVPLSALDIRHWIWGRASLRSEEWVWYLLWSREGEPMAWGLRVEPDGRVDVQERLNVSLRDPRVGTFGMPGWGDLELLTSKGEPWLFVRHHRAVDDGFFYQRWFVQVEGPDGSRGAGFGESVRPDRVDRLWNRPLVDMAVQRVGGRSSPFLPLFAGVRRGAA